MTRRKTPQAQAPAAAQAVAEAVPAGPSDAAVDLPEAAGVEVSENGKSAPRRFDAVETLGSAVWLIMQSPAHQHLFATDFEWLLVPPIRLRQFRVFRRKGMPIAFASWAFLDEAVEARLAGGTVRLAPKDWRSGDRPWLIDLVAPFGGVNELVAHLKAQVFKGTPFKALSAHPNGGGMSVVDLSELDTAPDPAPDEAEAERAMP